MNHLRHITLPVLTAILLAATTIGCKNRKAQVDSYSYLLKSESETAATHPPKNEPQPEEQPNTNLRTPATILPAKVERVIEEAESYLGVPYRYGGINKNGIDCSGLMTNCYRTVGVTLPRSSREQATIGKQVNRKELKPGDLVFFSSKNNKAVDHVGLVTQVRGTEVIFIHASTSKGVRFDRLDTGYWKNLYVTGRRPGA